MLHFAADTSRAVATSLRGVEQGIVSKCEQAARPLRPFGAPPPRFARGRKGQVAHAQERGGGAERSEVERANLSWNEKETNTQPMGISHGKFEKARPRIRRESRRSALGIFLPRTKCGGGGAKRRR